MRSVVVALGNFDGVHLGHQAVLRRAVEEARLRGERVVAATFHPHPRAVLRPGEEPKLLSTLETRRELLVCYGADEVYVIRFDKTLSQKSPEEFVRDVLVGEVGAGAVVVGENFRFGHRAAGDFDDLRRLMRDHGGDAISVPLRAANGQEGINSTRIRAMISAGDVVGAGRLLGRPYAIRGEVVAGDHRGRSIGFPTANLLPDASVTVPARGVYAGYARVGESQYAMCANIGVAPTFDRRESKIEAHLLDFDADLYGRVMEVSFVARIREEQRFSGVEELKEQIARDVEEARRLADDAP
ncbi:MAG TPA: bifunctional riboflavin kinase/FAD synthetase [Rubrobacteraceae bacterium]|nr:bifunctional riboflavin kinase/FAD synthetase [Rubrobacteraceae bacterium]